MLQPAFKRCWGRIRRASPIEWLYLAAGLALVVHYRWFFDDAFVYFRYVDNLLFLDSGLTYNRGEYVEGFTSPGFCLLLVALRALHLSYPVIVLLVAVACFGVFWYLLVDINSTLSGPASTGNALNFPLAYLSTNYAVTSFFTSGLETPLTHLAAVSCALFLVRPSSKLLALSVAATPMVRPELVLALGLATAFAWWRGRSFPHFLVASAALINGSWLVFRIYYYADFFPNTFYLKEGTRVDLGWRYLWDLAGTYHVMPVGLGLAALFVYLKHSASRRGIPASLDGWNRTAMLGIALVVTAYVVKIGGASMHYYYLVFPFTLAACASAGLLERTIEQLGWKRRPLLETFAMIAVCLVFISSYPKTKLTKHPALLTDLSGQPGPGMITDPSFHRFTEFLTPDHWGDRVEISERLRFAPELKETGYREWTISNWCVQVWVNFPARSVHQFGLTDGILARVDTPDFKRGHKPRLLPMAKTIVRIQSAASSIGRGMYREAVEAGRAPEWIVNNLSTIEVIERKIYNRHDFVENLRLALSFPPKLEPGAVEEELGL